MPQEAAIPAGSAPAEGGHPQQNPPLQARRPRRTQLQAPTAIGAEFLTRAQADAGAHAQARAAEVAGHTSTAFGSMASLRDDAPQPAGPEGTGAPPRTNSPAASAPASPPGRPAPLPSLSHEKPQSQLGSPRLAGNPPEGAAAAAAGAADEGEAHGGRVARGLSTKAKGSISRGRAGPAPAAAEAFASSTARDGGSSAMPAPPPTVEPASVSPGGVPLPRGSPLTRSRGTTPPMGGLRPGSRGMSGGLKVAVGEQRPGSKGSVGLGSIGGELPPWSPAPKHGQPPLAGRATSPTAFAKRYGSWFVPPEDWSTVYQGEGPDPEEVARLAQKAGVDVEGLPLLDDIEVMKRLDSRGRQLQAQLRAQYLAHAYHNHLQEHNLRSPGALERAVLSAQEGSQRPSSISLPPGSASGARTASVASLVDDLKGHSAGASAGPSSPKLSRAQSRGAAYKLDAQVIPPPEPVPFTPRNDDGAHAMLSYGAIKPTPTTTYVHPSALSALDGIELDEIISPEMREAVRKSLAMNDALARHDKKMKQYEDAKRAEKRAANFLRDLQTAEAAAAASGSPGLNRKRWGELAIQHGFTIGPAGSLFATDTRNKSSNKIKLPLSSTSPVPKGAHLTKQLSQQPSLEEEMMSDFNPRLLQFRKVVSLIKQRGKSPSQHPNGSRTSRVPRSNSLAAYIKGQASSVGRVEKTVTPPRTAGPRKQASMKLDAPSGGQWGRGPRRFSMTGAYSDSPNFLVAQQQQDSSNANVEHEGSASGSGASSEAEEGGDSAGECRQGAPPRRPRSLARKSIGPQGSAQRLANFRSKSLKAYAASRRAREVSRSSPPSFPPDGKPGGRLWSPPRLDPEADPLQALAQAAVVDNSSRKQLLQQSPRELWLARQLSKANTLGGRRRRMTEQNCGWGSQRELATLESVLKNSLSRSGTNAGGNARAVTSIKARPSAEAPGTPGSSALKASGPGLLAEKTGGGERDGSTWHAEAPQGGGILMTGSQRVGASPALTARGSKSARITFRLSDAAPSAEQPPASAVHGVSGSGLVSSGKEGVLSNRPCMGTSRLARSSQPGALAAAPSSGSGGVHASQTPHTQQQQPFPPASLHTPQLETLEGAAAVHAPAHPSSLAGWADAGVDAAQGADAATAALAAAAALAAPLPYPMRTASGVVVPPLRLPSLVLGGMVGPDVKLAAPNFSGTLPSALSPLTASLSSPNLGSPDTCSPVPGACSPAGRASLSGAPAQRHHVPHEGQGPPNGGSSNSSSSSAAATAAQPCAAGSCGHLAAAQGEDRASEAAAITARGQGPASPGSLRSQPLPPPPPAAPPTQLPADLPDLQSWFSSTGTHINLQPLPAPSPAPRPASAAGSTSLLATSASSPTLPTATSQQNSQRTPLQQHRQYPVPVMHTQEGGPRPRPASCPDRQQFPAWTSLDDWDKAAVHPTSSQATLPAVPLPPPAVGAAQAPPPPDVSDTLLLTRSLSRLLAPGSAPQGPPAQLLLGPPIATDALIPNSAFNSRLFVDSSPMARCHAAATHFCSGPGKLALHHIPLKPLLHPEHRHQQPAATTSPPPAARAARPAPAAPSQEAGSAPRPPAWQPAALSTACDTGRQQLAAPAAPGEGTRSCTRSPLVPGAEQGPAMDDAGGLAARAVAPELAPRPQDRVGRAREGAGQHTTQGAARAEEEEEEEEGAYEEDIRRFHEAGEWPAGMGVEEAPLGSRSKSRKGPRPPTPPPLSIHVLAVLASQLHGIGRLPSLDTSFGKHHHHHHHPPHHHPQPHHISHGDPAMSPKRGAAGEPSDWLVRTGLESQVHSWIQQYKQRQRQLQHQQRLEQEQQLRAQAGHSSPTPLQLPLLAPLVAAAPGPPWTTLGAPQALHPPGVATGHPQQRNAVTDRPQLSNMVHQLYAHPVQELEKSLQQQRQLQLQQHGRLDKNHHHRPQALPTAPEPAARHGLPFKPELGLPHGLTPQDPWQLPTLHREGCGHMHAHFNPHPHQEHAEGPRHHKHRQRHPRSKDPQTLQQHPHSAPEIHNLSLNWLRGDRVPKKKLKGDLPEEARLLGKSAGKAWHAHMLQLMRTAPGSGDQAC